MLGLDWERVSLSGYVEALECHNAAHEDKQGGSAPSDWLRSAMEKRVWL